jgi:hypothetical protein
MELAAKQPAREVRPVATGITSEQLGWPNSKLELYKMEEQWYFRVDQVLLEFHLKSHQKWV